MSYDLEQKKEAILKVYPNWWKKIQSMGASQITAIYYNMRNRGAFNPKKKKSVESNSYTQMTIFDYIDGGKYEY